MISRVRDEREPGNAANGPGAFVGIFGGAPRPSLSQEVRPNEGPVDNGLFGRTSGLSLLRYRLAPGLLPALVGLLLFYVALLLGAAVAVGVHALMQNR